MSGRKSLLAFKLKHIPTSGICPRCNKSRGTSPKQWTMLPNHMYCKYCFQEVIDDPDERTQLRRAFVLKLEGEGDAVDERVLMLDLLRSLDDRMDMVLHRLRQLETHELLTVQIPWALAAAEGEEHCIALAEEHVNARLRIQGAAPTPGRYLCGTELRQWLNKDYTPLQMCYDIRSVLVPPGLKVVDDPPQWLVKAMSPYTDDPLLFPIFSCAYYQALAKGMTS